MASDVLAQITNAWAANPDVSSRLTYHKHNIALHVHVHDYFGVERRKNDTDNSSYILFFSLA